MAQHIDVLAFAPHPDDAELHMGGLLSLYRDHGHPVKVISVTNGDAGHHEESGPALAARRRELAAERHAERRKEREERRSLHREDERGMLHLDGLDPGAAIRIDGAKPRGCRRVGHFRTHA